MQMRVMMRILDHIKSNHGQRIHQATSQVEGGLSDERRQFSSPSDIDATPALSQICLLLIEMNIDNVRVCSFQTGANVRIAKNHF